MKNLNHRAIRFFRFFGLFHWGFEAFLFCNTASDPWWCGIIIKVHTKPWVGILQRCVCLFCGEKLWGRHYPPPKSQPILLQNAKSSFINFYSLGSTTLANLAYYSWCRRSGALCPVSSAKIATWVTNLMEHSNSYHRTKIRITHQSQN